MGSIDQAMCKQCATKLTTRAQSTLGKRVQQQIEQGNQSEYQEKLLCCIVDSWALGIVTDIL